MSGETQNAIADGKPTVRSLFYWTGRPNFGDVLSMYIVSQALGHDLPLAKGGDKGVLLAIGSIIHYAARFRAPVIWGTGYEPKYGTERPGDARILALRGPLSSEALGVSGVPLGDPAILLPMYYTPTGTGEGAVGVVPHHASMSSFAGRAIQGVFARGTRVIDPRRDWQAVVDDIASCRFVFCESLHGAIIAQIYGIPWVWWKGVHGWRASFKWADWFASLGTEPRGFATTRLKAAERWAAGTKMTTPSRDDLYNALVSNVVVEY